MSKKTNSIRSNYNTSKPNSNKNKEKPYTSEGIHPTFIHNTPDRIAFDLTLTIHDIRIYMTVRSFMDTTGDVYASNDWIAKRLNVDRSTVIRSINKLCKKKYIARIEIDGHRHLVIVVNSMGNEKVRGVAQLPPPPSHSCHPIRSKIIKSNIIENTTTKDIDKNTSESSSRPIINKKVDDELLFYRSVHMKGDKRSDEDFLKQCSHHLDNGDKNKYSFAARLKGLNRIIKKGFFEVPPGYKENKVIKSKYSPEQTVLIASYNHFSTLPKAKIEDFMSQNEIKEARRILKL